MSRQHGCSAGGLVGLALLASCAAPPPAPVPAAPAPVVQPKPEPLPVTPVPVPQVVIVQSPPLAPVPQQAAAPQQVAVPQVNEEEQQALSLLVDLQRYVVEAGEDLRRELAAANLALTRASDANRIRLAMLLTLPTAVRRMTPRPVALEPVTARGGHRVADETDRLLALCAN